MYPKKFIGIFSTIILIMLVLTFRHVNASQVFLDITPSDEAYEEINYLKSIGVVKGYTENSETFYKPGKVVTRGQAAKMIVIASGNSASAVSESSFSDVSDGTEESGYIEKAVSLGLFSATGNGKFSPNKPLTREDMSYALSMAFSLDIKASFEYPSPFLDITSQSKNFKFINALYYSGITQGDSGYFRPNTTVTRSQFALLVARAKSASYGLNLPAIPKIKIIEAKGQVIVKTDNLNVHSIANSTDSKNIIGQLKTGDKLDSFGVTDGWIKVAYHGTYGYVSDKYVKNSTNFIIDNSSDSNSPTKVNNTDGKMTSNEVTARITVSSLNIRSGPGTTYEVIGKLSLGTVVKVDSISDDWIIITHNGIKSYINKKYVNLLNQAATDNNVLKNSVIILDPGHGGKDSGAINGKIYEKNITLNIATLVKKKLESASATVYMTRTGDTYPSLEERVAFAKSKNGKVFISIHVNSAASKSANGTETYYYITASENGKDDKRLAKAINDEIVANLDMRDRGIQNYPYYVVKNTTMPSVLVELGFITNNEDVTKMTTSRYIELFASSIYNGIVQFYNKNK